MKKVMAKVAIKGRPAKAELPTETARPGYLLTSDYHPGRVFAVVRNLKFDGRPSGYWNCMEQVTGYGLHEVRRTTLKATAQAALVYLAATSPEQLDEYLGKIAQRRALQFLTA